MLCCIHAWQTDKNHSVTDATLLCYPRRFELFSRDSNNMFTNFNCSTVFSIVRISKPGAFKCYADINRKSLGGLLLSRWFRTWAKQL